MGRGSANIGGRPHDPTNRRSPVKERVHIDEVLGTGSAIPTALPDLTDVNDAVTPAKGSVLAGDGSEWTEEAAGADGTVLLWDSSDPNGVVHTQITTALKKRVDIEPVATGDPRVFILPGGDLFIHVVGECTIELFHNGRRLRFSSTGLLTDGDFIVEESGGVGTGFDTVQFIRFTPASNSRLRVDYFEPY